MGQLRDKLGKFFTEREPKTRVLSCRFTDSEIKMMDTVTVAEKMSLAELVHTAVVEFLARRGL
jgi:hypothetical protein